MQGRPGTSEQEVPRSRDERLRRFQHVLELQRRVANAGPGLDEVTRTCAEVAAEVCGADGAAFWEVQGDRLFSRATSGMLEALAGDTMPIDGSFTGRAARTRQVLTSPDAFLDPTFHRESLERAGFHSMIAAPLEHGGEVVGVLGVVAREPGQFSEEDVRSLEIVTVVMAAAVSNAARARAEATLHEQAGFLHQLLEAQSDLGIAIVVSDGRSVLYGNETFERMLGYPEGSHTGRESLFDLIVADQRQQVMDLTASVLRGERDRVEFDMTCTRADGTLAEIECVTIANPGTEPRQALALTRDVTDRRHALAQLQRTLEAVRQSDTRARELLAKLVRAEEAERARIASEIHDDAVQVMAAASLRIAALRRQIDRPDLQERFDQLAVAVEAATARLRRLLFQLRPRALDTGGLAAATRLYIEDAFADTETEASLIDELEGEEADRETRVVVYRILLEAVSNVRRHAAAKHMTVKLTWSGGGIEVCVEDDGAGLPDPLPEVSGHLGLLSMRERAAEAGGWWRIDPRDGGGTRVTFWVPARRDVSGAPSKAPRPGRRLPGSDRRSQGGA